MCQKFSNLAFSSNMEIFRDIAELINAKYIVDDKFRWAINEDNRIVFEIAYTRRSDNYDRIYLEFCGDGIVRISGYNKSVEKLYTKVFDTHSYNTSNVRKEFKMCLLREFDTYILT